MWMYAVVALEKKLKAAQELSENFEVNVQLCILIEITYYL